MFFFFPFWHFGGGEKVHADILEVFSDQKPICFLTQISVGNTFQKEFEKNSRVLEFKQWAIKSNLKRILLRKVAKKINRLENPIVFGCNSTFFYKLLPRLSTHVKVIDLIHAFSEHGTEIYSIPMVYRIDKRVVLGQKTLKDFKLLYKKHHISGNYLDRIKIIGNKVRVPDEYHVKNQGETLKVLFVARNSPEKRFELFLKIALKCFQASMKVTFFVIGNFETYASKASENIILLGVINDRDLLNTWYRKSDLLLITSAREGFPMTIMEGMSYGVVPITTSVGEIPSVLNTKNFRNSLIIKNAQDQEYLLNEFVNAIGKFIHNHRLLAEYSINAYEFAKKNFGEDVFFQKYRELFEV